MNFTNLTPEEMERRRLASVAAMREIEDAAWERQYREKCDRIYWAHGQCCAGCDHWESNMGLSGFCTGAGIVSGADVMRSVVGDGFCSYTPPPGFPMTKARFKCGLFRDNFDWSTLDADYLRRIGAARHDGTLRQKPTA